MKIALFHNFLDNIGGAEIVTLTLARELNADIYTTNINKKMIEDMGFGDVTPRIISIGRVPINAPFRHQITLFKFRLLDVKKKYKKDYGYFIISGDWAVGAGVKNKPNLWYAHSPLNEIWAYKNYLRNNVLEEWKRRPFDLFVLFNRYLTKNYSKHIQKWVCNSKNTQGRIKKYYKKYAEVICPPIYPSKYHFKKDKGYWLSVNRLITHKQIELQMRAFSKMPNQKLIIVGSYEKGARQFESYKKYIESIKPENVQIINWAPNKKLKKLYSECKGFIATARDEDFGMTPVEAMASGKPVIAVNEGGYKESVIHGKTGRLISSDVGSLVEAIKEVSQELKNKPLKYKGACQKRAMEFRVENFIKKIKKEINERCLKN